VKISNVLIVLLLLISTAGLAAKEIPVPPNGLALMPPMGWSSWNYYGDRINEKTIIDTIDKMVSSGLRDAGYIYVIL